MKLRRGLGLVDVFSIASGAMISSGIFILPGVAFGRAGPAVVLSYLLAGLLAMTGMLSIAELATAMPKAGGDYFFAVRGMGPGVGTIGGLLTWFSLSLKSAFALVGMSAFTALVLPGADPRLTGVAFCLFFLGLNLLGVQEAARAQVAMVVALLLLMNLYVSFGLPAVELRRFEPFAPHGLAAIFSTAGFVFVSYGGLLKVTSVAEEVKDPGRVIPLGLIFSLLVVGVLYTLVVFVTSGVLPAERLRGTLTPISDGAAVFLGRGGQIALGLAAILAFVTTANAGLMAASRYLLALSRDRLLPQPLARVNARFRTPHVALLVTAAFMIAVLFLKFEVLVEAASTVLILSYITSNLTLVVVRESRLQNYRPRFRSPFYPWAQVLGIAGFGLLLLEIGAEAFVIAAGLVAFGFLLYWFYGRPRAHQEYALLHLIGRLLNRQLVTGTLETELKEIIRERDEIVCDRFDHVVEQAAVLDLGPAMSLEDFFGRTAEAMAGRLRLAPDALRALLVERERQNSSVLTRTLAVPHIVVQGERTFEILLARCRGGVAFSAEAPQVHAIFVLAGTSDERNFHLRALSALAQILQDREFDSRWLAASGPEGLRDVILLGERRRSGVWRIGQDTFEREGA